MPAAADLSRYRRDRLRFACEEAEAGARALRRALDEPEAAAGELCAAASLLASSGEVARRYWRALGREAPAEDPAEPIAVMPKRMRGLSRG